MQKDKRIDAYIARAKPFAQPVLRHVRAVVHEGCADVEETIKWGFPHFYFNKKPLVGMAAFKEHAALNFWRADQIPALKALRLSTEKKGMGTLGRLTAVSDLPPKKTLVSWVRTAARLATTDVAVAMSTPKKVRKVLRAPSVFVAAIKKNKKAWAAYSAFSQTAKNDYIEWIVEAKTDATRERRMAEAVRWMADGKTRNWKYQRPKTA